MCFPTLPKDKKKKQGKIHYIGNALGYNYADAWDDERGMMILDRENNKESEFLNWSSVPSIEQQL